MPPSSNVKLPVLVAGAGPSGLVAALTLLQNGVPVRIIDKVSHYHIAQRSGGVWPRTLELFHFLRTFEMHERARPMIPMREYAPGTLEPTKTFSLISTHKPVSTPSIPYNKPKFLGQPTIEGILRSHIEKYGCSVELGTELVSFEDNGERVLAKLVKRKDGEEICEIVEASYLIGTDGAKGITRKQLGLTFLGETREHRALIGDICVDVEGLDRNHLHFFGNRARNYFMLRPTDEIGPDGFQLVLSTNEYEPKQFVADEKLMFKWMSGMIGREIKVRKVVFLSEYRPNFRMVDKFGVGRVFVVGDAAHVHSPTGGQGLNTSVQDALNLAWKVSLVHKCLSPAALLDSYTSERLPVVSEMLNITTTMSDRIRKEGWSNDRAWEREERLNMLGVNYRTSPIVVDELTTPTAVDAYRILDETELVAGDRAPDAPELIIVADGTGTRLFDLFSTTRHTVLMFTCDASTTSAVFEVLDNYPGDVPIHTVIVLPEGSEQTAGTQGNVVIDGSGHAYRAYLVTKGEQRVVVVRPDGVVGAIVRGAEGVATYLGKIFHTTVTASGSQ